MDRHLTKRELTKDSEKQTLEISFNEAASLRRKYFYFFKVLAVLIHVRNPTDVVPHLASHANPPLPSGWRESLGISELQGFLLTARLISPRVASCTENFWFSVRTHRHVQ